MADMAANEGFLEVVTPFFARHLHTVRTTTTTTKQGSDRLLRLCW